MTSVSAYLGLFFSALLAATLFPAQSEAVLLALLHAGQQAPWLLWLVATLGNGTGSLVNWWLPVAAATTLSTRPGGNPASSACNSPGLVPPLWTLSLLLSWMPVLGDPLTLVAGRAARATRGVPAAGQPGQGRALSAADRPGTGLAGLARLTAGLPMPRHSPAHWQYR